MENKEEITISHSDATVSIVQFDKVNKVNISYLKDLKKKILKFEEEIQNGNDEKYGVYSHRDYEIAQTIIDYYRSHSDMVDY